MDSAKRWEYCSVPKCGSDPNPNPPTGGQKCGIPRFHPEDDFDRDTKKPSLVSKTG